MIHHVLIRYLIFIIVQKKSTEKAKAVDIFLNYELIIKVGWYYCTGKK